MTRTRITPEERKIQLTPDQSGKHRISFKTDSSLYGVTDAGGYAEDALRLGFVPLGDGCDYILKPEDKKEIKRLLKRNKK